MIIDDFYVMRAILPPLKANSPLLIDANTLLSITVSTQRFKSITGKIHQILDASGAFKYLQSFFCLLAESLETRNPLAMVELFGVFTGE